MITNKKGLSDVVTTVLIILLVLAAVGIVGSYVLKMINQGGEKISGASICSSLQVEPKNCTQIQSGSGGKWTVSVTASKKGTDATIKSIGVILYKSDGTSVSQTATAIPKFLETSEIYSLGNLGSNPSYAGVSVVPTITTDDGADVTCSESEKITCSSTPVV